MNDNAPDTTRLDRLAILLSGVCLVHCLAVPLSVLLLPALSSLLHATETTVHWILLGFAVPVSAWALSRGYQRNHGKAALMLGAAGVLLMLAGAAHWLGEEFEVVLTLTGASLLTVAHLINLRRNHLLEHPHD